MYIKAEYEIEREAEFITTALILMTSAGNGKLYANLIFLHKYTHINTRKFRVMAMSTALMEYFIIAGDVSLRFSSFIHIITIVE